MSRFLLHRLCLAVGAILVVAFSLRAQNVSSAKETALRFLQGNPTQFNLTREDVSDVRITDAFVSKHNGLTHVWVQQQHAGIPVYNALFGLHVRPDGSVLHLGHRFVPGLAKSVNTTLPSLSAGRALELAMANLGFTGFKAPNVKRKINERNWVFEGGAISRSEIPVTICYALDGSKKPRLAWNLTIDQANSSDWWTMNVDAQTGEILFKYNHTLYCKAGHAHLVGEKCPDAPAVAGSETSEHQATPNPQSAIRNLKSTGSADATYRVFALPTESPAHGSHVLVTNPHDPQASPWGWHDVDGADGAEYTYTRGNNVWAFEDSANDNEGSPDESADGGANLVFDFPFNPDLEPEGNLEAAVTNLFYMNNMIHDITYRFGFDEEAGNFQVNNYGKGGLGNDAVSAQAIDGSGTDNANFATPPDGSSGRMQMYTWSRQGGKIVKVNAPGAIIGTYSGQASSGWGGAITTTPITGDVVITDDGSGSDDATKNCTPPVNSLQGKIAMVDRGVCEFGRKALNAQQAGAIACIICNFEDATIGMAAGTAGAQVTIPTIMMTKPDCDKLRQFAGNGLNLSLVIPGNTGPEFLDGDFDNGIIAHEYGHGISNRLTGGPSQSGCLSNAEQMGEGWSDWFTLITGNKPGNVGNQRRGVGTYVLREPNDGLGIRRFPYSTDMSINPVTFSTVAENTQVHALGEIWAATTWDLYWAMVEKYGYDPDLTNPNSGNARAIQLVMDGMKLQPCLPGFLDGRNGIMAADIVNYNGADTCLISEVFARRGMGYFASQGSSDNAADGIENFDPIPTCVKTLKIAKETSTPEIEAGDDVEFTITVTNHKDETATNVVVTDPLPAGLSFKSASNGGFDNNGTVTWNLGNMTSGQVVTLTYTAKSSADNKSLLYYRDNMDEEGANWIALINDEGNLTFYLQTDSVKVGDKAWRADPVASQSDQVLLYFGDPIKINGAKPVMRFWHNYNTEAGLDAGFVEFQISGENSWRRLAAEKGIRQGYNNKIAYNTFAIPFISGFSGNSNGWVRSYLDMSEYAGKDINFRFRFGCDDAGIVAGGGWIVDQMDFIDMLNYESEACVTDDGGDVACAKAPASGVIVDTDATVSTDDPRVNTLGIRVQPNPATDVLTLLIGENAQGPVQVSVLGADGRLAMQQKMNNLYAGQAVSLDVQHLPAGMYLVRVESNAGSSVVKVAIR